MDQFIGISQRIHMMTVKLCCSHHITNVSIGTLAISRLIRGR